MSRVIQLPSETSNSCGRKARDQAGTSPSELLVEPIFMIEIRRGHTPNVAGRRGSQVDCYLRCCHLFKVQTAQVWPSRGRRRTRFAPIRPSPTVPSRTVYLLAWFTVFLDCGGESSIRSSIWLLCRPLLISRSSSR